MPSLKADPQLNLSSSDEDEYDDIPESVEALPGGVSVAQMPSVGSELLLELISAIMRLHVLIAEAEEEEVGMLKSRLVLFKSLVDKIPVPASKRRVVGFRVQKRKKRRRALR